MPKTPPVTPRDLNGRLGLFQTWQRALTGFAVSIPVVCAALAWVLDALGTPPVLIGAAIGLPLALLTALAGRTLLRRVARPLRAVIGRIDEIAAGQLDGRLGIERVEDEMDLLQRAIDEMTAYLLVAREARVDRHSLQSVIDAMPDALVVLDANGVVELSNRRFGALLGLDAGQGPAGQGLGTLTGVRVPPWYRTLLDTGTLHQQEIHFITADLGRITMVASGALIRDADDRPQRVVLLARDRDEFAALNAELDDANTRLAESEDFFQNLFDAMEDPITVLAPDGEVLQANKAARDIFGTQVIGQKCYRAFRMRDSVCDGCPALETYASKRSVSVEHRVFGNAITRISTYPLFGKNGEIRGIINHKRDVTKERQLEDLKAGFLAAVSHELRTPLTSIMGFNKLNMRRLVRHVQPSLAEAPHKVRVAFQKILDDMQVMDTEGSRLGRLVNDVLDLSKLEAGKLTLQMDEVDVGSLVNGAIAATSALWRAKALTMQADVPADMPPAWGDGDRLSQVVVNLLSNAIKFTDEGAIRVAARAEANEIRIEVHDSGKGIPPEELPQVFEKFRQVEDSAQGKPLGTGLGLPICRELIRLHEGRIWVDSTVGVGSTFSFTVLRADRLDDFERSIRERPSFAGY
ncbi:MAG: PAS domain-containing protein [Myxococcales bacterium]|nr:PAS domain-containing protein [Myxococcales bacterium]